MILLLYQIIISLRYLCFEGAEHADNERIVGETHDISFRKNLLNLIPQYQAMLVDLFQGEPLARFFMSNQMNRAGNNKYQFRRVIAVDNVSCPQDRQ